MAQSRKGKLVYSAGPGGPGPVARESARATGPERSLPPAQQSPRVRLERAGRGGKTVTVIAPLVLTRDEGAALLARLKKICGSGGTLKEAATPGGDPAFALEIQGDHADRLVAELSRDGYRVKRAGG